MYIGKNSFLLIVLLVNAFIVESRYQEIQSARFKRKISRHGLLSHVNDLEQGIWRNDGNTVIISCHRNNTLIVSGSVVKLSDIPPKPDRNCNNSEGEIIELFAAEKVIIDEDFIESGDGLTFIIIAPTWEVIGNRSIVLNGLSGAEYHQTKAKNGSAQEEHDGADGKPGLPGGRGGNFFGMSYTFISSGNLDIISNGGNGGPGQDGGDGVDGIDAPVNQFGGSLDELDDPQYRVESTLNNFDPLGTTTTHYVVHGQSGTIGGKGGDGGCGGKGATHGELTMYNLNLTGRVPFITYFTLKGSDGSDGDGGKGGKGGKGGCNARSVKFTHQNIHSWSYISPMEEIDNGYARDGKNGLANENRVGLSLPKSVDLNLIQKSGICHFKFFAMLYHLESTNDTKFQDFYNKVLELEIHKDWISVFVYQVELYYIEYLYTYSKNKALLLPFIRSLQQRIQRYYGKHGKVIFKTFDVRLQDVAIPHQFNSDFYNHLLDGCKWVEPGDTPAFIKAHQYKKELGELNESVKNLFSNVTSVLNEEIEGKIEKLKRKIDEKIDKLITEPSPLNDDEVRREELKEELIQRFALESIRFANLALQYTNIKVFVNCMLKLNNETKIYYLEETYFSMVIFPRNVQEIYHEIQKKYKNYTSNRIAIINSHQAFVEEQKQFASNKEEKALDNLSNRLGLLSKDLKSSNLVGTDPFLMEEDILLEEEIFFSMSKGSIKDSLVIKVIEHLKLLSLLGNIFGDSYERFANDNRAEEIGKIFVDFRKSDMYSKFIDIRERFSSRLLSQFDNNWITMGMASHKIEATKEIDFDEVKSNFYSYLPTFKNVTIAIDYLKEMQSQSSSVLWCYMQYDSMKKFDYWDVMAEYRQFVFPFGKQDTLVKFSQSLEKNISLVKKWKDVLKSTKYSIYTKMFEISSLFQLPMDEAKGLDYFNKDEFTVCSILDPSKCPSLYTWKNEMHKKEIADFLSGKEVTLKSIIKPEDFSAVKYEKDGLGIVLRSENEYLQEELARILGYNLHVSIKHHGDSHYKCKDYIYVIKGEIQSSRFNLDGISSFNAYKRQTDVFLLSPYATWTMQLQGDYNYTRLMKYKNYVDISLVGRRIYLNDFAVDNFCNDDLQKYYRKEDVAVEPEFVRNLTGI